MDYSQLPSPFFRQLVHFVLCLLYSSDVNKVSGIKAKAKTKAKAENAKVLLA